MRVMQKSIYIYIFVYGRWRIDTLEVELWVNIPEVEGGKQCVKMCSMLYRKSNRAFTYRKSRGVSSVGKWVAWKEKMTTRTFHARVVAHKGWGLSGKCQHENKHKDRHGLSVWLLWSRRIIALKVYFCSRKYVFKGFVFFANSRQVLLATYKHSHNILDSRVYLGYRI